MAYLDRIREANNADPGGYRPFVIDDEVLGWINAGFAARLAEWGEVFEVCADQVRLAPALGAAGAPLERRTRAVAEVLQALREEGYVTGWRHERYAVSRRWGAPPRLLLERAAVPHFGVTGYGVHLNGWVRDGGCHRLWVARRAHDKPTDPGKLDQLVAGGQPADLGLVENLVKECGEEAGIPPALACRAHLASVVTYAYQIRGCLRPDVVFVFDLELPRDFVPRNQDGEVAGFYLWSMDRVAEVLWRTRQFKFNSALVVVDFMIRRGYVSAAEPELQDLVVGLRRRERFLDEALRRHGRAGEDRLGG